MFTLENKYRDWREEVKKNYFLKHENGEDRLFNAPPPRVSPQDWAQLVANYNIDEYKDTMLAPPVLLEVLPGLGVAVEQGDRVGVEQHIQEPMEEEGEASEEQSSCTSVNEDEIIETHGDAPPPAEELNRMERELKRELEEMRVQNVRLHQKLEEFTSRCVTAHTQRDGNGGASGSQGPAK